MMCFFPAPGSGCVNFEALKPMIKPEQIKVFELSPRLCAEEAASGVARIRELWGPS